jgi:hypothetical protein
MTRHRFFGVAACERFTGEGTHEPIPDENPGSPTSSHATDEE